MIFTVRDGNGNAKDLGELVDVAANEWALRAHDPLALPELVAIKGSTSSLGALSFRAYRMLNKAIPDTHEMRIEMAGPDAWYMAMAPDGSAETAAVWEILKIYLDADGNPARMRTLANVKWSDRATLWP